jgi:serine/threonine protein phosphatase PrpC
VQTGHVADTAAYSIVTALSHVGLVRDHNEDSLVVGPWTLCAAQTETPQTLVFRISSPLVVAVADGLGGHPAGEVASSLVVRTLADAGLTLDGEDALREVIHACNRAVYAAAEDRPTLTAMGTTLAGVLMTPDQVFVFNVGDSRVYAFDSDGLRQASEDDSPPLAPGQLSSAIVTQTLGGGITYTAVDPHVTGYPLSPDVCWLVCTDGLSDLVPDDTLGGVLHQHEDGRAAYELWKAAIEAGGPDNITIALARVTTS